MAEEVSLVAYCGKYCNVCEIYHGEIKDAVLELRNILETNQCVQRFAAREGFVNLQKSLETLLKVFGECRGCKRGGGDPLCEIRECCMSKHFNLCIECDVVTCEKLSL
jgi:hypothetical protein